MTIQKKEVVFVGFCIALALMLLIESTMSYYFPIVVEQTTHSNGVTGMIIGLMNSAAIFCDFLIPRMFRKRTWRFLILIALVIQFGFPFFTNLGVWVNISMLFVLAALFWNVYFEFLAFARHNFVIMNNPKEDYSKIWGIFSVIISVMAMIGPVVGSYLLNTNMLGKIAVLHGVQLAALAVIIFLIVTSKAEAVTVSHTHKRLIKLSILRELGVWEVISVRILPIILLVFMLTCVNASVMTIGGLLGLQLFHKGWDWILVSTFNASSILISLFFWRRRISEHKKFWSQIMLLIGSICMMSLFWVESHPILVIVSLFACSIFVSGAWVLGEAVYSDLSQRAGAKRYYVNGMERLDDSFGWLLAPILIGFLSDRFGYVHSLGVVGIICFIGAIFLLIVTPRKLKLPQTEMAKYSTPTN